MHSSRLCQCQPWAPSGDRGLELVAEGSGGLEEQKIHLLPPSPCPCPSCLPGVAGEGRGSHRRVPKL